MIFLLIIFNLFLFPQNQPAVLEIRNTLPISQTETVFDIYLMRNSDLWERFANGTYYLELISDKGASQYEFDSNRVAFEVIFENSDLTHYTSKPTDIKNLDKYIIETQVLPNSLVLSILGPDKLENSLLVNNDLEGIRLASFRVYSKSKLDWIPNKIRWKSPYTYWQTTAYKNDADRDHNLDKRSDVPPGQFKLVFNLDDNINLINPQSQVEYFNDNKEPKGTQPRYVDAKYDGNGRLEVNWKTDNELFLENYVIKRIAKEFYTTQEEFTQLAEFFESDTKEQYDAIPDDFIDPKYTNKYKVLATGQIERFDPESQSTIDFYKWEFANPAPALDSTLYRAVTSIHPRDYSWIDTATFDRGDWVCYQVTYQNTKGFVFPLGYDCVQIPNSVISFANTYPNPFKYTTQLDYELLDDVNNLNISVYDQEGKTLIVLVDGADADENSFAKRGKHSIRLDVPQLASNGMYNLIITADPLNDRFVRASNASIKLQISR